MISLFCTTGLAAPVAQPTKASKPPAVFSHKAHLEETNQKCTPCHEGMVTNLNKCDKCHDDPPKFKFLNHSARLSFKFPHSAHEDVKECKACHQDVIDGKRAANTLLVPPEQCFTCHQKFDVEIRESDCAKCHGVDKRKEKPRYHDELWLKGAARHGRARAQGAEDQQDQR